MRVGFRKMPKVIVVRPYRAEELWMKDCRLEDISETALVISDEDNARSQTNLENVVCRSVPPLATFRQSGKKIAGPAPRVPGPGVLPRFAIFRPRQHADDRHQAGLQAA